MKPRFLAPAEAEFRVVMLEYSERCEGLGDEFREEVMRTVQEIGRHPFQFSVYEGSRRKAKLRRALVKRFPYVVIFDARPDEILIVAVSHGRRRPGYWTSR